MNASKESEHAAEREQASTSSSAYVIAVEELIKQSKAHWSTVLSSSHVDSTSSSLELTLSLEELEKLRLENLDAFQELQRHLSWGPFFLTFGYNTDVKTSRGTMEINEKFAEGGQAQLFDVNVTWNDPKANEKYRDFKWALKVFKEGTKLVDLQASWPQSFMDWIGQAFVRTTPEWKFRSEVMYGALLDDGRFGFLMKKEEMDLWSLIRINWKKGGHDRGPFSKNEAEGIMYSVAEGLNWLHEHGMLHRDLKAANVRVKKIDSLWFCYVADYECSVGVIGTAFFRAPEILQACIDKVPSSKAKHLFTKEVDIYSYGTKCYEVLTGMLPFESCKLKDVELVIGDPNRRPRLARRPKIPTFVEEWKKQLLSFCWQHDPTLRPSAKQIMAIIEKKSQSPYVLMRLETRLREEGIRISDYI